MDYNNDRVYYWHQDRVAKYKTKSIVKKRKLHNSVSSHGRNVSFLDLETSIDATQASDQSDFFDSPGDNHGCRTRSNSELSAPQQSTKKWRKRGGRKHQRRKISQASWENQDLNENGNPVINLSAYILISAQQTLLARGLGFLPDKQLNIFNTVLDVNNSARTLTLKNHFYSEPNTSPLLNSGYCASNTEQRMLNEPDNIVTITSCFSIQDLCRLSTLRSLQSESGNIYPMLGKLGLVHPTFLTYHIIFLWCIKAISVTLKCVV